jgi:uncharacterized membrane protein YebE (DUF533 family)
VEENYKIVVTFNHKKYTAMKKMIVALALVSGVAVIAYASLQNRNDTRQAVEKQSKQEMKKECKKRCLYDG